MSEVASWIANACEALGVHVKKLPGEEAKEITEAARAIYVRGNPRAWWLSWTVPCETFDSTKTTLGDILPLSTGNVWLLPESENDALVYEIHAASLEPLLAECPYFEYYVLAPDLSWLVAESDHNVFFVCHAREP